MFAGGWGGVSRLLSVVGCRSRRPYTAHMLTMPRARQASQAHPQTIA